MKIKYGRQDRIFYVISGILLTALLLLVAYPLIYVLSSSFSSGNAVSSGKVVLLPVSPTLDGYKAVFRNHDIPRAYLNTVIYTVAGTALNIFMVITCGFVMSRKELKGRKTFMFLFTFTMYFGGGMIPAYLLIRDLSLLNSPWVMIIPGALSVYNMIVARTFIQSNIPEELFEASSIDGCSYLKFFARIVVPLSKAVIAVIALFSSVGHWNAYFDALIYLNDRTLYPLQLILREILVLNQIDAAMILDPQYQEALVNMADTLKYALIVVATVPILCVYPFIQKYFVKGVMIGSIKG